MAAEQGESVEEAGLQIDHTDYSTNQASPSHDPVMIAKCTLFVGERSP
jgi:NADH pyrophosphatase NudC (nudix superfamily)